MQLADDEGPATSRSKKGRYGRASVLALCLVITLGRPLAEGEIVMSGALGPMVPVAPGEVYVAEIAGFTPVQVAFEDGGTKV